DGCPCWSVVMHTSMIALAFALFGSLVGGCAATSTNQRPAVASETCASNADKRSADENDDANAASRCDTYVDGESLARQNEREAQHLMLNRMHTANVFWN